MAYPMGFHRLWWMIRGHGNSRQRTIVCATPDANQLMETTLATTRISRPGAGYTAANRETAVERGLEVLPFANMSSSQDDEYFSDGLAEDILNVLAHIPGLKVTARTSSFAFRGERLDIRKIAEILGVRTILEGSVRRADNRIRVTAQLINAADGYRVWSERYDRELMDVFAIQDEVAAAIVTALQGKLVGEPAVARRHQPNLPAYEAFLKGRT
jgi:TolB-like protein